MKDIENVLQSYKKLKYSYNPEVKFEHTKKEGGEFMSNEVYFWSFHFYEDKLHTIDIVFRKTNNLDLLRSEILKYLRIKYGYEDIEKPDFNGNVANSWYFFDAQDEPTDLINLLLIQTARGDRTYQVTYVNISLFEESEQGD